MSFAFSGVIISEISFLFNPSAEIKTLSSASVALINIRRIAFSKPLIFEIYIPLSIISMLREVITQLHDDKQSSIRGKLKYTNLF